MKIQDFDTYDQSVLKSAVKAGRTYAKVVDGPEGPWVAFVSLEDPIDVLDRSEHRHAQVVRLEEIEGLAEDRGPCLPAIETA